MAFSQETWTEERYLAYQRLNDIRIGCKEAGSGGSSPAKEPGGKGAVAPVGGDVGVGDGGKKRKGLRKLAIFRP
jgi:hypothetical protein